jgi:hypothetical protein
MRLEHRRIDYGKNTIAFAHSLASVMPFFTVPATANANTACIMNHMRNASHMTTTCIAGNVAFANAAMGEKITQVVVKAEVTPPPPPPQRIF